MRTKRVEALKNYVIISDPHIGCQFGLYDPTVNWKMDGGGLYRPSMGQEAVYHAWLEFWEEWVPMVTKGEEYVVVLNGDAIDGVHHKSVTQITHNVQKQRELAYQILKKRITDNKACVKYYHLRGTEAHVGPSGQDEEALARDLGAIPDEETGNYARWDMWLRTHNKALLHFSHHIGTTASSSYESTAVYKEMVEAFNEAGRWREEPPDVIIRSHRHRQFMTVIGTAKGMGIVIVTPGWQLKTPFVYRLASGRSGTPQIGGYVIRTGDEDDVYARFKLWKLSRSKEA